MGLYSLLAYHAGRHDGHRQLPANSNIFTEPPVLARQSSGYTIEATGTLPSRRGEAHSPDSRAF